MSVTGMGTSSSFMSMVLPFHGFAVGSRAAGAAHRKRPQLAPTHNSRRRSSFLDIPTAFEGDEGRVRDGQNRLSHSAFGSPKTPLGSCGDGITQEAGIADRPG